MRKQVREQLEQRNPSDCKKQITNATANGSAVYLEPHETEVFVNSASGYTQTIYLPFVALVRGVTFHIHYVAVGGNLTIADQLDSKSWANATLATAKDSFSCVSDGRAWHVLQDE